MVFKAPMHAQASGIKSTFVWSRIWLFTYVIDNLNKKYDGDEGFVLGEKKSCKQGYLKHWVWIYKVFDPIVNMRAVLYKNLVKSTVQIGMKGH